MRGRSITYERKEQPLITVYGGGSRGESFNCYFLLSFRPKRTAIAVGEAEKSPAIENKSTVPLRSYSLPPWSRLTPPDDEAKERYFLFIIRAIGLIKAPLCKGGSHRRWVGDCKEAVRIVVEL